MAAAYKGASEVTLSMAILLALVVSLTLTPIMASRFLRVHHEVKHSGAEADIARGPRRDN
jgi:HAE1 family hydrophobic/amphiphilic exporter-1